MRAGESGGSCQNGRGLLRFFRGIWSIDLVISSSGVSTSTRRIGSIPDRSVTRGRSPAVLRGRVAGRLGYDSGFSGIGMDSRKRVVL